MRVTTTEGSSMNYLAPTPPASPLDTINMSAIDFDVIRTPVFGQRIKKDEYFESLSQEYAEIPNLYEYRRADNDVTLGVHTGSYAHNGYQKHMAGVLDAIKEMSYQDQIDVSDMKAGFEVYEGGKKLKLDITFPRHIIEPAIGDITKMRLRDWDSYDGSWGRRLTIDGFRLWCFNGCTSPSFKLGFYAKHTKAISSDESIARMINSMITMVSDFSADEEKFKRWIATSIEHDDAMQMFSKTIGWQKQAIKVDGEFHHHSLNIMQELNDHLKDNFREAGRNLYAVYNAATQWATHVGQTKGQVHNVERTRESKVSSMLNSDHWNKLERFSA